MLSWSNKCSNIPSLIISRAISCTPLCYISNHYIALGLTPAASKDDIKKSYFELCKKYHPDKNKGSVESAKMFRIITEAYEVLGNEKSRKLYDNSMFYGTTHRPPGRDANQYADYNYEEEKTFYKKRNSYKTQAGRTWYYDFDAWRNAHYPNITDEELLKAEKERKRKWRRAGDEHVVNPNGKNKHFLLYVGIFVALGCMLSVLPLGDYSRYLSIQSSHENNNSNTKSQS